MENINSSLGDRRGAREHEQRIMDMTNLMRPALQFQASIFRMWASGFETLARNVETAGQQTQQPQDPYTQQQNRGA